MNSSKYSKFTIKQLREIATAKGYDPALSTSRSELIELLTDDLDNEKNLQENKKEIHEDKKYVFYAILMIIVIAGSLVAPILLSLDLI